MKTKNTQEKWPVDPSAKSVDFKAIEKRVFHKHGKTGVLSIGGVPLTPQIRDLLREQAQYLLTSNLFEIMDATITNEAAHLALVQSANFEHVEFAKALYHWNHVLKTMLQTLVEK